MKKKTKKPISVNTYQAGGLLSLLPNFEQYQGLTNTWNNYWKTGTGVDLNNLQSIDYDAEKANYNRYKDNVVVQGNFPTWNTDSYQAYTKHVYNQSDAAKQYGDFDTLTPNQQKEVFDDHEIELKGWNNDVKLPELKGAKDLYIKDQFNNNLANLSQVKYQNAAKSDLTNVGAGIFTGLNYMNAYKPPEPIHFKKGFQGIQYQDGGNVNNESIIDKLDIPQKVAMQQIFGEYVRPSELMNGNEIGSKLIGKDNYGLLADILLDPLNAIPLSKVKYAQGLKGEKVKKALSTIQKALNVGWGADKVNDINTAYNNIQSRNNSGSRISSWQDGGNVNTTGYTPNTPSFNNEYNIIPSNQISMKETPFPVIGVPNKGKPMVMQPGQQYTFHGAKYVKELPLKFQFGGYAATENENSIMINPIFEDVTEIQTETGEYIGLEDNSIVRVKATKLHKNMKNDKVTDILPGKSYIFSNDESMILSLDKKVNGIDLNELSMGKGVFEYKENEFTKGPEDIQFNKIFKGKTKATPAELANNIKNIYKIVESKSDFFTERANMENREQRGEYLSVLKALNEYKKPKSDRQLPQAKFGMAMEDNFNVGLPKYYNNYNNAIDTYNGLSMKAVDPYKQADNNFKAMYNISSVTNPKLFKYGGVPQAQLGKLLYYTSPLGIVGEIFGNRAERKQKEENARVLDQYKGYQDQYLQGINQSGQANNLGTLGSYLSSLNTPLAAYDDMNSAYSTIDNAYGRANKILESSKYTANGLNSNANSAARYMDPNTMGAYMANTSNQYNQTIAGINGQLANNELSRASTLSGIATQGTANRNNAYNSWRERINAANTQGIANLGTSYASSTMNNTNALYKTQLDRLAFEDELRQRAANAKAKVVNEAQGVGEGIGQAAAAIATSGASFAGGIGGNSNTGLGPNSQSSFNFNPNQQGYFNNFNPSQSSLMVQLRNLPPQLLNDPNVLRYLFKRN